MVSAAKTPAAEAIATARFCCGLRECYDGAGSFDGCTNMCTAKSGPEADGAGASGRNPSAPAIRPQATTSPKSSILKTALGRHGQSKSVNLEYGSGDAAQSADQLVPTTVNLKGNLALKAAMNAGAISKRKSGKFLQQQVVARMEDKKRNASLNIVSGLAEQKGKFEDVWNTTDFQTRMLRLCQSIFAEEEALPKFNILNEVRNDMTSEDLKELEKMFALYAALGADNYQLSGMGKRAESIDFNEFKQCLIDLKLLPAKNRDLPKPPPGQQLLNIDVLGAIFEGVNDQMEGIDDDENEFSFEEFYVAMCLIAVFCNKSMDSILFPERGPTETLTEIKRKKDEETELYYSVYGLSSLIKQEHMRILQSLFHSCGGSMTIDQFTEHFGTLLNIDPQDAEQMFLKIDYNNDGDISWDEFAGYILALAETQTDVNTKILEHLINPKVPHEFMHTRTISAVAMVRSNQWRPGADKYVTFSKDGPINVWTGVQGMPQKQEHPFALRGAATFVLSAHALTMHNVVAVASNDERVRFYGFEPRFKLDLELLTVERRAMAMHSFAMKPGPDADWSSWFVWGDDCGSVHFIPENVLVSYRHGSIGLKVAEIKFEQMASEHGESIYSADLFTGWVTCMEYISEINGLHGALAIGSNDGNVVIFDSEERCVLFRYEGHSLAVKCLTWLRNYRSIASSGLDRDILLWDPLSGHKTGRLGGHKSPVINLCFYGQSDHLFSLDLRYQLYIWDAQKQLLVQQINTDDGDPFVTKNRFRAECIAINTFRGHIAICGKRPYVWKINEEEKTVTGAVIHQTQIITVIYNSLFNQIITAEVSGLVSVWEVISGRQSYFFRTKEQNKDGAPDDVSVAILDPLKRCLFVGFASGRIKSYNLHNGVATNEFFTAADVTKRTEYPIVGMLFSEKITADMGMGTPQDPHLFVSGLDATGAASVWIWATIHDHHTFELMPMKKMTLPSWRNDCFVDFTMSMDHQTGFLACGRVDGHVIVWNVQTGMVKRDVDHVFWFMDIDGDGSLTSEEVSTFLRSREGYTEQEVEEFMHRADYDKNSEISKLEFQLALERRGTVSKINPETGKLAKDRPGSSVVFTSFVKRIDDVIVTATADGFVMFSNYKKADLLHTFSAIPQPETPTAGHLHQEMLTGCLLDEREVTIFVTTNAGNTYVWDISLVTASSTLKQQLVKKIGGWKEADDELSCCEYLESQSVLLLAKAPRDPKMLPSVRLYHLDGTVAGSLGGDDPWMLCQDTQHAFLQRIKMGLGQKQKVVDDKVEDIRDFNFASMMKVETKSRKSFRQTNLVQQTGLLKGAAITMANRNAFRVKALRYKELQLRLQRARLFLEARMVNSVQIHKAILQDLEDVWREELEHMTLSDFEHNAGPKMNFGAVEETMLGEVDKEDRVLLLVRKFVLEELFKKKKGQYMLPPNDELTEEARTFVLSHYKKYQPHHAIHEFTPDSASTEDKEGDNTEYESNLMISDKEPWFHASVIKIFIISQVLSIKVASGDKDLLSYIDGDDLPINEQSRVFREQYGYSPHWDQDVSNEVRKRTSKVAAECKSILEKKDILAKKSETWLGRILSRDPENMPAPSVGIFETSHQTLLGNEVGSGHHHLIGPISHRRLSVRGPRGISEFEKTLPYPGEPASDHLGWSDLYVPKLNEPFKLKPSPNNLSAYRQRDLELSSSGQTGGDGSATAVELEGGEEKALDIVVKPHAHALKKNPKSSFSVQKMKREESGADISSITARLIVAFDNELEMPRHGTNSQESPGVRKAEPSSNEKPKGGGIITFKRRQQRFLDDGPVDADGISPERQSQRMIPKGSHFILRSPRSPSIPCTPSRATLPVRRTPRSTFSNSPRGKGDESKAAHESLVDLGFETPRQTSRWQTRSWDGETEKPPRLWTCKLRNVPLADEYLPAITKIAPTGVAHSRSSSGPSSRQPMPGDLAGSKTSVGTASLDSNLLLGVGESPETITWQLRRLSLEDQLIYVHIPHIDEHGRSCWEKKVLCHLQHDSDIEKVADDPGSVGRCGALLLSWGPNFQRLHLFIAGREAGVVLEWFLAVRNIIDFLVRHESHATQEKIHLYESKRVAKRTFRLIRKAEDLELKQERSRQLETTRNKVSASSSEESGREFGETDDPGKSAEL